MPATSSPPKPTGGLERQQLVKDFLDRVDVLSAKISTSAARFTGELAEKDALLQQEQDRVLAYAQLAATAQSVIDDMRASNSWRLTSPGPAPLDAPSEAIF